MDAAPAARAGRGGRRPARARGASLARPDQERSKGSAQKRRPAEGGPHGAGDEIRTRDIYLGKVVLYQLSYSRKRQARPGLKPRPRLIKINLLALTYSCRGLPPNYHRRWRA